MQVSRSMAEHAGRTTGDQAMTQPGSYQTPTMDMIAVHAALIGSLDDAPNLIGRAEGDAEQTETIGSFYENVLEFLNVHHQGEDLLLYPLLDERCPEDKAIFQKMGDQHSVLDEPMANARAAVAAWRESPSADRARDLISSLSAVSEGLRPHLEEEETVILPIASKWISAEEWGQLPAHAMQTFESDKPWLPMGLIRERVPEPAKAAMLERMPPPVQEMWREQWEPAYNSFIAEVRR
jgi:hemerythrin-like domain-containing protein